MKAEPFTPELVSSMFVDALKDNQAQPTEMDQLIAHLDVAIADAQAWIRTIRDITGRMRNAGMPQMPPQREPNQEMPDLQGTTRNDAQAPNLCQLRRGRPDGQVPNER